MIEPILTTTPARISAVPTEIEKPDDFMPRSGRMPANSLRNNPNLATTKPNPIKARPVRIQARKVRSAAK